MNGNTPYAGQPGTTRPGRRTPADVPRISRDERRALHREVSRIAARTREFLPDEYAVDAEITAGVGGPQATVAVQPPVGHPVSAGFTPEGEDLTSGDIIDDDDRAEVARGLAASAALQVKRTVDDVTPTAR